MCPGWSESHGSFARPLFCVVLVPLQTAKLDRTTGVPRTGDYYIIGVRVGTGIGVDYHVG